MLLAPLKGVQADDQVKGKHCTKDIRNSRLIRSHFGEFESQDDSARSTRSSYKIDVSLVRTDTLTETFQIIINIYVFK
jgi:hypothetical protein